MRLSLGSIGDGGDCAAALAIGRWLARANAGVRLQRSRVMVAVLVALLVGCASTETVKEAQGQGVERAYPYPCPGVYAATLAAAKARQLEVVDSEAAQGWLILSHGVTRWSWGERIAVFAKPATPDGTPVEIVSKPVLSPLSFPPDWQKILFDQIDVELGARP